MNTFILLGLTRLKKVWQLWKKLSSIDGSSLTTYAKLLSDFLWSKKQELTPKDLSALDMVPYDVWRRMSEKSNIVVQVIMDIYKEGKEND